MKWTLLILLVSLSLHAHADIEVKTSQQRENTYGDPDKDKKKSCESFNEFQKSYEKLMGEGDLALGEEKSARLALRISRGCNGASTRFFQAY